MKFQLDPTKNKDFPHRPPFSPHTPPLSIDMTLQKWAIFIMGCMGKFFVFCRNQLKIRILVYKKRWGISWKFQLEITSNKKNVIAKKPLTNLYEMNSSSYRIPIINVPFLLDESNHMTSLRSIGPEKWWRPPLDFDSIILGFYFSFFLS